MKRFISHNVSAVLLLSTVVSAPAFGHARFKLDGVFKPRTNDTGLKTAPCGGAARTASSVALLPGQTVTVEWEETVDHPGFFRISFSPADDLGFDANILVDNIADTQNDGVVPHVYRADVTLPNQTCTACTLQLIQVMTEDPLNPTNYYSCSDIQLNAAPPPPAPVSNATGTAGDAQVTLSWQTPVDNAAGVLVLQDTVPVAGVPTDGQKYALGATIGTAVVQFSGKGSGVTISGLNKGAVYYYALFTQSPANKYSSAQQVQVTVPLATDNAIPQVKLETTQGLGTPATVITPMGGPLIVTARVTDANPTDTHTYSWTGTDARLVDLDAFANTMTIDPHNLSPGPYTLRVDVTDSGIPPQTASATSTVVVAPLTSVTTTTLAPVNNPPIGGAPTGPGTDTDQVARREKAGSLSLGWLWLLGAVWLGRATANQRRSLLPIS